MRVLLDTQLVLWWLAGDPALSATVVRRLREDATEGQSCSRLAIEPPAS